jgi:hypothetical protein
MNTSNNGLKAIQDLFSFPFRDPQWKNKLLIGSALTFGGTIIPLLPIIPLLGYGARIMRSAAAGQVVQPVAQEYNAEGEPIGPLSVIPPTLPEWDNWNELFTDGLRQLGVMLLINLPLFLLFIVGFGLYFAIQIGAVMEQVSRRNPQEFPFMIFVGMGVLFITMGLSFILTPITYLFLPTALAHVAVSRRFAVLFQVKQWFRIFRANMGGYLAMLFFLAGLYVVLVLIIQVFYFTIICCFLLPIISSIAGFFGSVLFFHVSGLAYAGGRAAE